MKAILCGCCNDFKAIPPTGAISCSCGNVQGWWTDSRKGIAKVYAKEKQFARILGIDNSFLIAAYSSNNFSDKDWRDLSELCCKTSEGYLFHTERRNCPFLVIKVGESSDVSWSEHPFGYKEPAIPGYGVDEFGGSDY